MKNQQSREYRFSSDYQEKARLKDGTIITLRLLIPADKLLLANGMDSFSPESRYQRFLGPKKALTDADLYYLTEINGVDHFAIGAILQPHQGIGVARFVRFGDEYEVAEPAIAVLDLYQHKGLGKLLFTRLMDAAKEREVKRFRGNMLADNRSMRQLLHSVGHKICFEYTGQVVEFEMLIAPVSD